jgi:hypothetical protein
MGNVVKFVRPAVQGAQETTTVGLLRVELWEDTRLGFWRRYEYCMLATELVDPYAKLLVVTDDPTDIKPWLKHFKSSARARWLRFDYINHTGKPAFDFSDEEKKA